MGALERIAEVLASLPEAEQNAVAEKVINFLKAKTDRERVAQGLPDAESQAWLDADLGGLSRYEAYDWGDDDPLAGRPVVINPATGRLAVLRGEDA